MNCKNAQEFRFFVKNFFNNPLNFFHLYSLAALKNCEEEELKEMKIKSKRTLNPAQRDMELSHLLPFCSIPLTFLLSPKNDLVREVQKKGREFSE